MSDKDLQIRISELPKLDFFDSNSLTPLVGRSEGIQSTGKASLKALRDYFDFTSAYNTLKEGVDATKKDERFFVYSDASKVFAIEYINIGGSAVQVQDPVEGIIYYPTRRGIVGSLGSGVSSPSFADLRKTRPLKDGAVIFLTGYYEGSSKGSGEFLGFNGQMTDDGGMVAKGNGFYWVRNTDKVSPEMFGAYGDGVKDDGDALTRTLNSTLDVECDGNATYLVNSTIVLKAIKRQQSIDGNGATIVYTDKSRGLINQYDDAGVVQRYTKYRSFSNLTLRGPANKNSSWATVSQCDGLNISNGIIENCKFYGWSNAMRGFGEAYVRNCYGDDLRTAMFSCYDPGYNEIIDSSVGWCSGDAIILKGASAKAHNIDIVYAGCIDKNNEDGATALPGCILSMGADGAGSQNIQVSNISCQYFGCAGLNIQGDGVTVSGDMNLGSIYEDNFQSANQASALWIGAKNFTIGNLHFGKVHMGVGINGNCANGSIGRISIMAKTNRAGSTLFSATDGPNSSITKVIVESIDFYGSSTINNDIYINTDGLYLKHFYVYALNNSQGGYTVSLRKNARIGKMILAAVTSSATNPVMLVESDSVIDHLEFRRVFGTALTVETNANPIINKMTMSMKQGILPPFVIKGDGTKTLYWGDVDITGPSVARPTINGKLCMLSYQGPTFRATATGTIAGVSVPNRSFDFADELRMVGPAREGDVATLKGYYAGSNVGGGTFVGRLTTGTDDGGAIIAGNGYYWERQFPSTIRPAMFGAVPTDLTKDYTDQIQKAANFAINSKTIPLELDGDYRVSKTIRLDGVPRLIAAITTRIYANPNNFTGDWVVTFGDPTKNYGEGRIAGASIDGMLVVNADNRDKVLNGIYCKGSWLKGDQLRVSGFNGCGVKLDTIWDSTFQRISVELCGNLSTYAFDFGDAGADTANCTNIVSLQVEKSVHRNIRIKAIRSRVQNIHSEQNYIVSTNDGTTGLVTGLNYLNNNINLGASQIDQWQYDCAPIGSTIPGTTDKTTTAEGSSTVYMDFSEINNLTAPSSSFMVTGGQGSSLNTSRIKSCVVGTSVGSLTVNGCRFDTLLHCYSNVVVNGGYIGLIRTGFNAESLAINNADIFAVDFNTNNILGNVQFTGCKFAASVNIGAVKPPDGFATDNTVNENYLPVTFKDCYFKGSVVGSAQTRAVFDGGFINTVNLVANTPFEFKNVRVNSWTHAAPISFITENVRAKSVTGTWDKPNKCFYPASTITNRIGPVASGDTIEFINSASASDWLITKKAS